MPMRAHRRRITEMKTFNGSMRIESMVKMQANEKKKGYIYLYDDIGPDEYDFWNGTVIVSETSEKFIRDRLSELEGVSELEIHISSRGGYVSTGLAVYSQIKAFECPKKTAYIDGIAASIATVIAMAADEVVMNESGLMMIHNPWAQASGNAEQHRKLADDLDIMASAAVNAYLGHAKGKISEEKLRELMGKESWLTADRCMEYGLCDTIIDSPDSMMRMGADSAASCRMNRLEEQVARLSAEIAELQSGAENAQVPMMNTTELLNKFFESFGM